MDSRRRTTAALKRFLNRNAHVAFYGGIGLLVYGRIGAMVAPVIVKVADIYAERKKNHPLKSRDTPR